jgi:hypothetical protein
MVRTRSQLWMLVIEVNECQVHLAPTTDDPNGRPKRGRSLNVDTSHWKVSCRFTATRIMVPKTCQSAELR